MPPWDGASGGCCRTAPLAASKTLKNCLLIGDSVTNGMSGVVTSLLKESCQTQKYIGNDAIGESGCWDVSSAAPMGDHIDWDVIHFNEGLHSLWPRVNSSAALKVWAAQLRNFTRLIKSTHPKATLIYATMTPFMPEKFAQDGRPPAARSDVEAKNKLAVETVKREGVTRINDLYSVITAKCGDVYANCSICDDESRYHSLNSTLPCWPPVQCGASCSNLGALSCGMLELTMAND